eukprot:361256_1
MAVSARRLLTTCRFYQTLQIHAPCSMLVRNVQRYNFSDKPFFKSTISIPESDPNVTSKTTNNSSKFKRRFRKFMICAFGVGFLYYLAIRKLQRKLDDMDVTDLAAIYSEGIQQGFIWYYKRLALGMLRADQRVLTRFECETDNELLIVSSEKEQTLEDMVHEGGAMEIEFNITNKEQSQFGTVNIQLIPVVKRDGTIGSYMLKDLEGQDNKLHIILSVTMADGHEIIVFDKELTESDYDMATMEQWFKV